MKHRKVPIWRLLVDRLFMLTGSAALTTGFFMVLPLIQAITSTERPDTILETVDAAELPPPPPPPPEEEEPEEEPETEEEPPELTPESQPLDLSQLELALNPGGFGDGWMAADFAVDLSKVTGGGDDVDALFSIDDLDQKPRVIYRPSPAMNQKLRRKAPGRVVVIFIVNERGRVENPRVKSSSDPVFERAALSSVKQWKFEPGKRKGKPVRFRMRCPITFPKE